MGEAKPGPLGIGLDRGPKPEFHGRRFSSDGGLLTYREWREVLGVSVPAGQTVSALLADHAPSRAFFTWPAFSG